MKPIRTPARPSSWALRTSASLAALAVGAIGLVGFASAASADNGECVPADAITHDEHTYTRTITQWSTTNPGDGWASTGEERVLAPAVLEHQAKKWDWTPQTNGQLMTDENIGNELYGSWDYKWFSHEHDGTGNGRDWMPTGVTQVKTAAAMEFAYTRTETTDWLTKSPGSGWVTNGTRAVIDTEAVVCDDDADPAVSVPSGPAGPAPESTTAGPAGPAPESTTAGPATPATPGVVPAAPAVVPAAPAVGALAETGNESLLLLGLAASLAIAGAGMVGIRRSTAQI